MWIKTSFDTLIEANGCVVKKVHWQPKERAIALIWGGTNKTDTIGFGPTEVIERLWLSLETALAGDIHYWDFNEALALATP